MKWTKENAIAELENLAKQASVLQGLKRNCEEHIRWIAKTRRFLAEVFGEESTYFSTFATFTWSKQGSYMIGGPARPNESFNPQLGVERVNQEAYVKELGVARGLLLAAKDELEEVEINEVYKGKDTKPETSLILKIINLAEYKLRKVIRKEPTNEKEVQDAFESLLVGADISFSRETERIEYSSKTYTPDFTMERAGIAVEVKFCNRDGREKEIIAEINDDILAYKTKYGNIVFVIYDIGCIRDVERFAKTFEDQDGVVVRVVKH